MIAFQLRLKRIDDGIAKIEIAFCCLLLIVMVTVTGVGIFFRYVLRSPLIAGMNFASLLLVWLTFFGASAIYKNKGHMALDIIVNRLPGRLGRIINICIHLLIAVIFLLTAVQTLSLIKVQLAQQIVALGISRSYLSYPVIISSVLMSFTSFRYVLNEISPVPPAEKGV